jgi:hypothetical protein
LRRCREQQRQPEDISIERDAALEIVDGHEKLGDRRV